MKSQTSLVAQQTRLSEWAEQIRECNNRPQGMTVGDWCQSRGITKANYYWRLRKVREALLETGNITPVFVELPAPDAEPAKETDSVAYARLKRHDFYDYWGSEEKKIKKVYIKDWKKVDPA